MYQKHENGHSGHVQYELFFCQIMSNNYKYCWESTFLFQYLPGKVTKLL